MMLMRIFLPQPFLVAAVVLTLLPGCGGDGDDAAAEPESETSQTSEQTSGLHDVPLTEEEIAQLEEETAQYEDAIEHIEQFQETIQQETTQGDPAAAHRAMDKLDVVLKRLPEAARNSGIPKQKWQEINETAQQLRDLFNQVHANIDAGENPNYEAVADQIDRAIEKLKAIEDVEPTS